MEGWNQTLETIHFASLHMSNRPTGSRQRSTSPRQITWHNSQTIIDYDATSGQQYSNSPSKSLLPSFNPNQEVFNHPKPHIHKLSRPIHIHNREVKSPQQLSSIISIILIVGTFVLFQTSDHSPQQTPYSTP